MSGSLASSSGMSLNGMIAMFQGILNRDDCTTTTASQFILEAMAQIQRDCRLVCMERQATFSSSTSYLNSIPIPDDFIEPIDVFVQSADGSVWYEPIIPNANATNTWLPLKKLTTREFYRVPTSGVPKCYCRVQGQILISGMVPQNIPIVLYYYGTFTPFSSDGTSSNEISTAAPDLVYYKALSLAGDYFQHDLTQQWEARYQQILASVQQQSKDVDANGGPQSVQSAYGYEWRCWNY